MAIRFRCQCGQKLRVSDDRAGMQAKCPKCRTALTVPRQDERGQPEPAAAGGPHQEPITSPPVPASTPAARTTVAPATVETDEFRIELQDGVSVSQPGPIEEGLPEIVIRDDSTDWVVEPRTAIRNEETTIDYDKVAIPRRMLYLQGGLLAVVALLSFILGMLVSGRSAPREALGNLPQPCVLSGQVMIALSDDSRPDAGSVVIALPADRRPAPDGRVAIAGLRPEDPIPVDNHASLRAIRGLGGDCVRANENGEYQIRLPQDGAYFVLVISRRAARSAKDKLEMSDVAQMGRYFDNVTDLVDDRKYQWRTVALRGDTTLDATF